MNAPLTASLTLGVGFAQGIEDVRHGLWSGAQAWFLDAADAIELHEGHRTQGSIRNKALRHLEGAKASAQRGSRIGFFSRAKLRPREL